MSPSHESTEACAEHKISVAAAAAANDSHRLKSLKRAQWLRAAILGANDGLISTASLMLGVGAAKEDKSSMVLSGLGGALAGACSMAVGEFVSVATQRDIEKEIARSSHKSDQEADHAAETAVEDGTKHQTSPAANSPAGKSPIMIVVKEDAEMKSRLLQEVEGQNVFGSPYNAAGASGLSFICGAFVPILTAILVSDNVSRTLAIVVVTSFTLAFFGGFGAYLGGSRIRVSAARVLFGGWVAMGITYGLLKPFDNDDKEGGVDKD